MINYFDSLTHPTINGEWLAGKPGINFRDFASLLRSSSQLKGAVICGLPGVGGYDAQIYYDACNLLPQSKPLVLMAPLESTAFVEKQFYKIKEIGYSGVKVHGRLLGAEYTVQFLQEIFRESLKFDLPIYLCTYCYSLQYSNFPDDLFRNIVEALKAYPKVRLALIHAGVHDLIKFYELARQSENLLLDFSYIVCKYNNLYKNQFEFIFKNLDQRVCVGSDLPDYSIENFCTSLEPFFENIIPSKVENICFHSLEKFFKL